MVILKLYLFVGNEEAQRKFNEMREGEKNVKFKRKRKNRQSIPPLFFSDNEETETILTKGLF